MELPETVPGTPERLIEIAREVTEPRLSSRARDSKARLQSVVDKLDHLGRILLEGLQQQVAAPPAKEVEAQLEQVVKRAQALQDALSQLPFFSLEILDAAYHAQRRWDAKTRVFHSLGLGTASAATAAAAIHAAAQQQLRGWRDGTVLGRVSPTLPGPMRAYQRIVGDPRAFVANQVAQLVIREQGAAAVSAEEDGSVYIVMTGLWEWATGLPEDGAHLRKYVRQGVKSALLQARRRAIEDAIEDEVRRYHASPTDYMQPAINREFNLRIGQLRAEAGQLRKQEARLLGAKPERRSNPSPA